MEKYINNQPQSVRNSEEQNENMFSIRDIIFLVLNNNPTYVW